jgi:hypothetical protein
MPRGSERVGWTSLRAYDADGHGKGGVLTWGKEPAPPPVEGSVSAKMANTMTTTKPTPRVPAAVQNATFSCVVQAILIGCLRTIT